MVVMVSAEKLQQKRTKAITSVITFFKIIFFLPVSFLIDTPPFNILLIDSICFYHI
jgi:hypothetical protein